MASLDLSYMKLVRFTFSLIDCWPHRDMKSKNPVPLTSNRFLFCVIFFVCVAEVIYVKNNVGVLSFLILGHTYITILITFNSLFRLTLPWSKGYRQLIIDFIENIHVFHYKDESEYSKKNFFVSFVNTFVMCINELFISLIAIHLWGHFKILENNLINFPRPIINQSILYNEEESIAVKNLLVKYMNQHKMATDFLSKTVKVFGPTMCLYYLFQQISECIVLCEICKLDTEALGKYGILTLVIFQQLIQISVVYEIMSSMNEKIVNAVYNLPWENMNVENQKIVFFLQNVQIPFNLRALDMVPIGAQTMVTIIRTSFSYFIMLRTIAYD
nr:odorant receptor 15 [Papilio memnon]